MVIQEIVYPFEYVWHESTSLIRNTWHNYFDVTQAAYENQDLHRQVSILQAEMMDYKNIVSEVARLRALLGFAKKYTRGVAVVEVVGHAGQPPFQSLRIARGSRQGLQVGMPVVAAQGIVGRILRTGQLFSDVQVLGDNNFNVDVLIERTRARGILHGVSALRGNLQLHRRADIRIGDTLVTSGATGSFPKGLPVGRVIRIRYDADNVSQTVTIQPWVDYRRLEEVLVLNYNSEGIAIISETIGPDWLNLSEKESLKKDATR